MPSCGTKYISRQVNTDQILLFELAFEFCASTNPSSISKRTLDTLPQSTPPAQAGVLANESVELIRQGTGVSNALGLGPPTVLKGGPGGRPKRV